MKQEKMNDITTLGGRMKSYEKLYNLKVSNENHIICRIDGHHFSKFTKGIFKKPFDTVLSGAMIATTADLVERFGAYTGYTQSDEITLFIPSMYEEKGEDFTHIFDGRVQKMTSLISAYATLRFNYWLRLLAIKAMDESDTDEWLEYCENIIEEKLDKGYFDCRIYGVRTKDEVINSFLWRYRDCIKNSKSMFAQAHCSHKSLLNKNGEEQIAYCLETTGNDWNVIKPSYKFGTFIKKEEYKKFVSLDEECTRTRLVSFSLSPDEDMGIVLEKYKA